MATEIAQTTLAAAKAKQVLADLGLDHPCDMEIEDIAFSRGVLVREDDLDGADGWLTKIGGQGIIRVKRDMPEHGRKRFTIAHELGHFELHEDKNQLELCTDSDLLSDYKGARPEEREANLFATELLMPEALVRVACRSLRPGFTAARDLSGQFQTTLTMAAMRFVQLTHGRVALIASEGGRIKWFKASAEFGHWLQPGALLDKDTCAADFFAQGKIYAGATDVMASAWIKGPRVDPDAFLKEECFAIPRYKTVLSMIWMVKDVELQDE